MADIEPVEPSEPPAEQPAEESAHNTDVAVNIGKGFIRGLCPSLGQYYHPYVPLP